MVTGGHKARLYDLAQSRLYEKRTDEGLVEDAELQTWLQAAYARIDAAATEEQRNTIEKEEQAKLPRRLLSSRQLSR